MNSIALVKLVTGSTATAPRSSFTVPKRYYFAGRPMYAQGKKGGAAAPVEKAATSAVKGEHIIQGQRAVVKQQESIADIRSSLAQLCETHAVQVREMDAKLVTSTRNTFLKSSGFKSETTNEGLVSLTKDVDNMNIRVMFDPLEEKREEENNEENYEEEGTEEEQAPATTSKKGRVIDGKVADANADSQEVDHPLARKQQFDVDISFKSKDGKIIGKWYLTGFAGTDERLYITDVATANGEPETPPMQTFPFAAFPQEFQDRMYDLMDEVGIDDQLAHFIRQYVAGHAAMATYEFLDTLGKFMKST